MPVHVYGNGDVDLWATAKDSKKFVITSVLARNGFVMPDSGSFHVNIEHDGSVIDTSFIVSPWAAVIITDNSVFELENGRGVVEFDDISAAFQLEDMRKFAKIMAELP